MIVNFAPSTLEAEIEQNITCILETVAGTVPLDRSFGLDSFGMDTSSTFYESQMTNRIITAIQEAEPRVVVTGLTFERKDGNTVKPIVRYNIVV
jgi:phage baseplate assembly protein W